MDKDKVFAKCVDRTFMIIKNNFTTPHDRGLMAARMIVDYVMSEYQRELAEDARAKQQ